MLVFIDESGHPHPNDAATHPTLLAVCIPEGSMRGIARQLYSAKRAVVGKPEIELKAVKMLTRQAMRRKPTYWELVASVFELCQSLPITAFSVTMDRPTSVLPSNLPLYLPNQFRYLLQRVNQLCEEQGDMATILFDDPGQKSLAAKFGSYLFRSQEGQALARVADAPYFVDSKITPGIQIADLMVGVVRLWEENALYRYQPTGDPFLSAVARFYGVIKGLSKDFVLPDGRELYGMCRMPERAHYPSERIFEGDMEGAGTQLPQGVTPGSQSLS